MLANITTIDGPPAAGKTTMASLLAQEFGRIHLDSGSIFRALTLHYLTQQIDLTEQKDVVTNLHTANISVKDESVFLNGENVSAEIRDPRVTNNVCHISNIPEVRKFVKDLQLFYAKSGQIVCDGRKVGTEVFPDAKVKFYLTADFEIRALRRFQQLLAAKKNVCFKDVKKDLYEREKREKENGILLIPKGAIVIDNTNLTIETTLMCMEEYM